MNKKNNNKKHNIFNINTFIIVIFVVITTMYMFGSILSYITTPHVSVIQVEYGEVDSGEVFQGIITRDETVYVSPADGIINFNYIEYERMRQDEYVAYISNPQSLYNIKQQKNLLNSNLINGENEISSDFTSENLQLAKENQNIKKKIDNFNFMENQDSYYKISEFSYTIEQMIFVRNKKILGYNETTYSNDSYYEDDEYKNNNIPVITAIEPGILSFTVDGLETTLVPENVENLTEEQVKMTSESKTTANGSSIKYLEPAFKIVTSNEWYISSYINSDVILGWEEGDKTTIYIENQGSYYPVDVEITHINKEEEKSYVVFKANKYMIDYIDTRNINFKIVDTDYEGFKIPSSAIVNKTYIKIPIEFVSIDSKTDEPFVLIKTEDGIKKNVIEVDYIDDEYMYIRQDFQILKLGSEIVNPNNESETYILSETTEEKGVYVVNNGIATFEKIEIDKNVPQINGYYIIDAEENKNIEMNDYIIEDSSNIEEGMKVYR